MSRAVVFAGTGSSRAPGESLKKAPEKRWQAQSPAEAASKQRVAAARRRRHNVPARPRHQTYCVAVRRLLR